MRVFVTGGTGFIGAALVQGMRAVGHEVVVLTRSGPRPGPSASGVEFVRGDVTQAGGWMREVGGCEAVVHLAGEPLMAQRWTSEFKRRVIESRVAGTRNVVRALEEAGGRGRLLSASAIGYYGSRGDEELDESASPGDDFLAEVCRSWESEAARAPGRPTMVRIGIVLGAEGGTLARMLTPFKLFVGGPIGSGDQWVSWIHLHDLVRLFLFALENESLHGPVNATAPNPVTMRELARTLGHVLGRPSVFRVPALALRVALGEAGAVVVESQRVFPRKAVRAGFEFKFPTLQAALVDLLAARGPRDITEPPAPGP